MVIDIANEVGEKAEVFEAELTKHPNIQHISIGRNAIGGGSYTTTVLPRGMENELNTRVFAVDQEFFETYQMDIYAGRTFLKGSVADTNHIVVNEAFAQAAGWDNPVGETMRWSAEGEPFRVLGVVKDFHYHPLSNSVIEPMVFYLNLSQAYYCLLYTSPSPRDS